MIIPQIAENLTGSDNVEIPKGSVRCVTAHGDPTDEEAQSLYCTNEKCPPRNQILHSVHVSRDALNIDGLEATLRS